MQHVFIIGAAKCGTTSLAEMLQQHQDICVSNPKETDFFTNEGIQKGTDWYEQCFAHQPSANIRVDASVSYSAGWGGGCDNIAKRIYDYSPKAKIIYLVRDPLARTWSAYWHARRSGYEAKSFLDSVSNLNIDHIQASLYHKRLQEYQQYFERPNIMVISQKQLLSCPQEKANEIFNWLKIDSAEIKSSRANESYQVSGFGLLLHRFLPIRLVKFISRNIRKGLPSELQKFIKSIYSKPLPTLNNEEIEYLLSVFEKDSQKLLDDYGVDVRTGDWWRDRLNRN